MGRDWQRATFTDLKVMEEWEACEQGWNNTYNRAFYGLDIACNCLDKYGWHLDTENEFVNEVLCDRN